GADAVRPRRLAGTATERTGAACVRPAEEEEGAVLRGTRIETPAAPPRSACGPRETPDPGRWGRLPRSGERRHVPGANASRVYSRSGRGRNPASRAASSRARPSRL